MTELDRSGQQGFFGGVEDGGAPSINFEGGAPSQEVLDFLRASRNESITAVRDFITDPSWNIRQQISFDNLSRQQNNAGDDSTSKEPASEASSRLLTSLDEARTADMLAEFFALRDKFRNFELPERVTYWDDNDVVEIKNHMLENDVDHVLLASLDLSTQLAAVKALEKLVAWHCLADPLSRTTSQRAQRWIFATLARLEAYKGMNSEEVAVVRELGKKAIATLANRLKWMREGQIETDVQFPRKTQDAAPGRDFYDSDPSDVSFDTDRDPDEPGFGYNHRWDDGEDEDMAERHDSDTDEAAQHPRDDEDDNEHNGEEIYDDLEEDYEPMDETLDGANDMSDSHDTTHPADHEDANDTALDPATHAAPRPREKRKPFDSAVRRIYEQGLAVAPPGSERDPAQFLGRLRAALHAKRSRSHHRYMSAFCCLELVVLVVGQVYGQRDFLEKRAVVREAVALVPE